MAHTIRVGGGGSILVVLEDFTPVDPDDLPEPIPAYVKHKPNIVVYRAKGKTTVKQGNNPFFVEDPKDRNKFKAFDVD